MWGGIAEISRSEGGMYKNTTLAEMFHINHTFWYTTTNPWYLDLLFQIPSFVTFPPKFSAPQHQPTSSPHPPHTAEQIYSLHLPVPPSQYQEVSQSPFPPQSHPITPP